MIEAERAFAAAAQRDGQWTAFRAYAAPYATMFVPQPVKAQEWLKGRKDPTTAVAWSPTAAFVSCDGKWAVTTGEWRLPGGKGYFSTVWRKGADERWRWVVDGGDELATSRARVAQPPVRQAACEGTSPQVLVAPKAPGQVGQSADGSLIWQWEVDPDGARRFQTTIWNGHRRETVIDDRITAPAAPKP